MDVPSFCFMFMVYKCECPNVLCTYSEYIFEFVNDIGKVWFSCPDDVIYKQNKNLNNFSLITKSK